MAETYSLVKPTPKLLKEIGVCDDQGSVRTIESVLRRHGVTDTNVYLYSASELRIETQLTLPDSALDELRTYSEIKKL